MTAARDRIAKALRAKGYIPTSIEWQPIGAMVEMSGREGGWTVVYDKYAVITGYNVGDVLSQIAELSMSIFHPGHQEGE